MFGFHATLPFYSSRGSCGRVDSVGVLAPQELNYAVEAFLSWCRYVSLCLRKRKTGQYCCTQFDVFCDEGRKSLFVLLREMMSI